MTKKSTCDAETAAWEEKQRRIEIANEVEMRDASGEVEDDSKLVFFLYTLLRDHLSIGAVEQAVRDAEALDGLGCIYVNGWMAKYAQHLAKRLAEEDIYQPDPAQDL